MKIFASVSCAVLFTLGVLGSINVQAEEISSNTIEKFAHVEQQVNDIRVEYIEKSFKTASDNDTAQLFKEAETKMAELIEQSGLKVPEYNAVAIAARQDANLRQRIQAAQ